METEEKNLSPEQSLGIISSMIQQAQGNVRGNSFFFLLWGWVIAVANFGMYYLIEYTNYERPEIVWLLVLPAGIASGIYGNRLDKSQTSKTHLDTIYNWLWVGYAIGIIPLWAFGYKINYMINPMVLLFTAMPTFLSGIILRFTPLIVGGISFVGFGTVCFLVDGTTQLLIGGIGIVCGYLVPGYLLRYFKENRNV